jgi:hypothetical protein
MVLFFGFVSVLRGPQPTSFANGNSKFFLEFNEKHFYQALLNGSRKKRGQINKIEGGVMCADMEFDFLGVI